MRLVGKLLFSIGILALVAGSALALPPSRQGPVDPRTGRYRTTGMKAPQFPKELLVPRLSPQGGKYPYSPKAFAAARGGVRPLAVDTKTQTAIQPLVLLIDFADRQASSSPAISNPVAFDALFFGSGPTDLSVRNYWNEVSYGNFAIRRPSAVSTNPDVVGWLRAGGTAPSGFPTTIVSSSQIAGINNTSVRQLLADAIASLSAEGFNFSPYVRPSDNTFNSVIIVQPGAGQEDSNFTGDTYSHSALIAPISTAAGTIVDYTIVPAKQYYNDPTPEDSLTGVDANLADDPLVGIGVIVHEMGHLFGLPDLYPGSASGTANYDYSGVGVFDLMGFGLWGNVNVAWKSPGETVSPPGDLHGAENPTHLSAWSKADLGWTNRVVLPSSASDPVGQRNALGVRVAPAETGNTVYQVYPNGPGDASQYFLLENRRNTPYDPITFPVLFDKGLPGSGILIWRVDAAQMANTRATGYVNNDNTYPSLALMEADLSDTAPEPHLFSPFAIGLFAVGQAGDFFLPGLEFSRNRPVSLSGPPPRTNSAPIINPSSVFQLFDAGLITTIRNILASALDFLFDLFIDLPYWKDFNTNNSGIRTNQALTYGFDSAGRTWVGTGDQGVWIFSGANNWKQITGFRTPRIQAMQFEPATGSMWVGTDNSVAKVRLDAVQASFPPLPGVINVRGVQIARDLTKWVGGGRVLAFITDDGTNQTSGLAYFLFPFPASGTPWIPADEEITCLALDNVNSTQPSGDKLFVGTSRGNIYYNNFDLYNFNTGSAVFRSLWSDFPQSNSPQAVYSMALDAAGILWVGTDRGVFAVDRDPQGPILFNPFDLAGDNVLTSLQYFPNSFPLGGTDARGPRGLAFQNIGMPNVPSFAPRKAREIVWVAWGDNNTAVTSSAGGAERIDPNVLVNNPGLYSNPNRVALSIMKFAAVPSTPEQGPVVSDLISAGSDGTSVWFGTNNDGAVRFGSGASLQLDKTVYINLTPPANVTLIDDNAGTPTLEVRVTSTSDGVGFDLSMDRGTDNVYRGSFGFTNGVTDNNANLISVKSGDTVTVTYRDVNPPLPLIRNATWKSVFPFSDSLFISPLCFVSTAAFGSPMAPEVVTFRAFRDRYLLGNAAGRAFVELYYRWSPPLAEAIARSPALRAAARFLLVPAAQWASFAVAARPGEKGAVLLLFAACSVLLVAARRRGGRSLPGGGPDIRKTSF